MKLRLVVAAAFLFMFGFAAEGAEIKVLCAGGFGQVIQDLGPKFERATGHKLSISVFGQLVIVKRLQSGETADVIIIPRQVADSFVQDGKVVAGNVSEVARSGLGVAVRQGAPKPDISSPEALRRALLAAKSITYGNPADGATTSVHFAKVLDRLGIANEMKSKVVSSNIDEIVVLVATGKAEIGVHQLQNLVLHAGIDVVGPLPGDLQDTIIFTAAIMSNAGDAAAAKALVNFLRTPNAATVIKAKGMDPATL